MPLFCFKRLPSNFARNLVLIWFYAGERLLLNATKGLMLSANNFLDF